MEKNRVKELLSSGPHHEDQSDSDEDGSFGSKGVVLPRADEKEQLRKELGDISLGELQKLKHKVGIKRYNQVVFGSMAGREDPVVRGDVVMESGLNSRKVAAIDSENRAAVKVKKSEPMELSSKKPASRRKILPVAGRPRGRDPRFDNLSGNLNMDLFEKSYAFVSEIKANELKRVRKQLRRERRPDRKTELHKLLQRLEQEESLKKNAVERKHREKKWKESEVENVQRGKKAFFLKKSDKRKLELAEKYKELKSSGGLQKYLSKKRKRNAAKERRNMPVSQRDFS